MSGPSAIEWTERTWNPIVGCSIHSAGCTNCYAMKMAGRLEAMARPLEDSGEPEPLRHYLGTTTKTKAGFVWTGKVNVAPDSILMEPLRRKKATTWFVNSMSDLFHESVPDEVIDRVFAIMALCPQHRFQVLTKRAARMRAWACGLEARPESFGETMAEVVRMAGLPRQAGLVALDRMDLPLPRNVWLGVSVEDQRAADERIPHLLATPAAVRFLSCEPLLGPVDLRSVCNGHYFQNPLTGHRWHEPPEGVHGASDLNGTRIDWVICGGESGAGARPMHPDWARSLRDQCAAADVPFFFKQWGDWISALDRDHDDPDWRADYTTEYADRGKSKWLNLAGGCGFHGKRFHVMRRVGKTVAGRWLDGVKHNGMPAA